MTVRYQVFISSTYTDLRDERQSVLSTLLQVDAIPAGMELFPAADETAWALIERFIEECDYYLLLIGGRYGSVDSEGLSYTEREYDLALRLGKPVMAFLHGSPEAIPSGKADMDRALQRRLAAFRKKVEGAKHVKYWVSAEDLAGKVALSYTSFVRNYPAVGWMRGDQVASVESVAETNALRKQIEALREQVQVRGAAPAGSERLAAGSELHELALRSTFNLLDDPEPKNADGNAPSRGQSFTFRLQPSWNEIFEAVGSRLWAEGSEADMKIALSYALLGTYESDLDAQIVDWVEASGYKYPRGKRREGGGQDFRPSLSDSELGRILVQFRALGYIERSTKNRSLKDKNRYWRLTDYGESVLISLMAIESGVSEPPPPSDTDEEETLAVD